MAYANGTTHYNLPLTVGSDKRDWADTNQAFSDLDAAVYAAVTDTGTQETEISALETRMDTADQNISGNASDIAALDTRLTTAEGSITSQAAAIDDVRSDGEDMICAYNEATATSTHAYAIGDYFIYNDVLYRVTAGIAIGDTIVPDTNCTTTNVTTELLSSGSDAVDMICTVTENTTTATRNYNVGDYFILNDVLYKVTATITVGTTIMPGTNCTSSTVCNELINDRVKIIEYDHSQFANLGALLSRVRSDIMNIPNYRTSKIDFYYNYDGNYPGLYHLNLIDEANTPANAVLYLTYSAAAEAFANMVSFLLGSTPKQIAWHMDAGGTTKITTDPATTSLGSGHSRITYTV